MSEFIGLPIEGDINMPDAQVDQRPIEELADLLKAVLESPLIYAIRWHQYTPYFNDGDACVFSVNEPYFRFSPLDVDLEEGVDQDGFFYSCDDEFKAILGGRRWNSETRSYDPIKSPNPELSEMVSQLSTAMESGAHNVALINLFGDHAKVTATPEKFIVDEYDHD